MFSITDFFERYKHLTPPDASVRKAVVTALEKERLFIEEKSVRVIGSIVYLESDTVFKNAVFMKKNRILESITALLGREGMVRDIR